MLAARGWRIIGTGRNPQRCDAAEAAIRAAAPEGTQVDFLRGDFCEMADVARLAGEICQLADKIHVLVNNAGGVRDALYTTSEGIEATFAANHLAPFVLTARLMPLLEKAAATSPAGTVRVIATSSAAHEAIPAMNFDDLMMRNGSAGAAYCQAKLANILITRELDRRLEGSGIVAQSMHPGLVHTNFASYGDKSMQSHFEAAEGGLSPEEAARTIVWLATEDEGGHDGGRYFHDCAEITPAPQALDDAAAARLWQESEAILEGIGMGNLWQTGVGREAVLR